jgi:pimeloyl-ACP methyl ester carboxylesterase
VRAPHLPSIKAPVLLIYGRYDRMVLLEVSIAILNHIADWHLAQLNRGSHHAFDNTSRADSGDSRRHDGAVSPHSPRNRREKGARTC